VDRPPCPVIGATDGLVLGGSIGGCVVAIVGCGESLPVAAAAGADVADVAGAVGVAGVADAAADAADVGADAAADAVDELGAAVLLLRHCWLYSNHRDTSHP